MFKISKILSPALNTQYIEINKGMTPAKFVQVAIEFWISYIEAFWRGTCTIRQPSPPWYGPPRLYNQDDSLPCYMYKPTAPPTYSEALELSKI